MPTTSCGVLGVTAGLSWLSTVKKLEGSDLPTLAGVVLTSDQEDLAALAQAAEQVRVERI